MSNRFAATARAIRAVALASVASGCLLPATADAAPLLAPLLAPIAPVLAPMPGTSPSNTSAQRPIYAYSGNISPYYGNINAFYGNINAFYGNINAFYGNINAFSGDLSPFYGNINAFWGNINPFYGNINAFWGNINAFYGNINAFAASGTTMDGYVKPTWGNIGAFWGQVGPTWGNINAFWGNINAFSSTAPDDYANLAGQLRGMADVSRNFWGAAIQSQTGKSFDEAFLQPMLAKWGVDLNNPMALANLSEAGRQRFMLDWYDQLMNFSGTDHVDWWMKGVNWTPALTTALGNGTRTTIGILDFSIVGSELTDNIRKYDGISTFSNGHGTAVASLIVSPQDGKGVMGIAPMAQVIAYNPFDSSGTANWTDVTKGVVMLVKNGASVVNMSLGVPGWTFNGGWNDVFTNSDVQKAKGSTLFVIAAGNDGAAQTQNVVWNSNNPNFVLVGSVDPTGTISSFSNRPGTACLVGNAGDACKPENALMNRFIVAPGEMILVSDGQGGVTRMSGTSFAAPLVSGAVALIHNRWPWLQKDPATTMRVLLGSARDLGAPGVDPVYGVGELDVAAAVEPLDASKLQWYKPGLLGTVVAVDARTISQASASQKAKWEADGVYYFLYEQIANSGLLNLIGNTAYRDFAVPLSTKLFGQSAKSLNGSQQQLSDYLYYTYVAGNNGLAGTVARRSFGFSSFSERGGIVGGGAEGYSLSVSLAPKRRFYGYKQSNVPYQTSLRIAAPGDKASFRFGFGDGAVALGGQRGLGMISDYDVDAGGANPLLGMASGGAYANVDVKVAPGLRVAMGYSEQQLHRDPRMMSLDDLSTINNLPSDTKRAMNVAVSYTPIRRLTLNASLTQLNEDNAVLGVRSVDPADFAKGAQSNGVTLGADFDAGSGFGIAVSATQGRTTDRGSGYRNLAIGDGGFRTSAYELALSKTHLFDTRDQVRLAVSQPMHVDRGSLDFTSVQVIDRQTGELGVVTQSVPLPTQARQIVGEMLYTRSLLDGTAGVTLFGRAQLRPNAAPTTTAAAMGGVRLNLDF
jgi:hypothetical protein